MHSQEVLLQRSDVEAFLLSSLHTVRKEMERESLWPRVAGEAPSSTGVGGRTSQEAVAPSIKDLPWEDRERVLRLLFSKINNLQQHTHFTSLPPHPLAPGQETGPLL